MSNNMQGEKMEKSFKVWIVLVSTICFFFIVSFAQLISHSSGIVGHIFSGMLYIFSLTPLILALNIKSKWRRRTAVILSAPLFIFSVLAVPFIVLDTLSFKGGIDPAFELVKTFPLESSEIRAYRTNCGATCSYGIVVRQEMPLFWGVTLTRVLLDKYKCDRVTIEKVDPLLVKLSACSEQITLSLKRMVYF